MSFPIFLRHTFIILHCVFNCTEIIAWRFDSPDDGDRVGAKYGDSELVFVD